MAGVIPPVRHAHTGSMRWGTEACMCVGCGQRWVLTSRGWYPVPMHEPDPTFEFDNLRSQVGNET